MPKVNFEDVAEEMKLISDFGYAMLFRDVRKNVYDKIPWDKMWIAVLPDIDNMPVLYDVPISDYCKSL